MIAYCTKELNLNNNYKVIKIEDVYKVAMLPEEMIDVFNTFNSTQSVILARNLCEDIHCLMIEDTKYPVLFVDSPELIHGIM